MSAEHAYIMLVSAGDSTTWAYPPAFPTDMHLEKTWPALAISNSDEIRK